MSATLYPKTFDAVCREAVTIGDAAGLRRKITPDSTLDDFVTLAEGAINDIRAVARHADTFGITRAHGHMILGILAGIAINCRFTAEAGSFAATEPEVPAKLADAVVPASASRCELTVGELIEDGQVALADLQSVLARLQHFAR